MRKAPVNQHEAKEMLAELQAAKVLEAYRGKPASDINALSEVISKFSEVVAALEDDLIEADLNPVMVFNEGHGVRIADGLMTFQKQLAKI